MFFNTNQQLGEAEYSPSEAFATACASRGWRILPLKRNEKIPAMKAWPKNATKDLDRIQEWWAMNPQQGYGIVTGKESCIVLDVDVKKGQPGLESLASIFTDEELASFVIAETPTGGKHIYFAADPVLRNAQGFLPGLDIRGNGGYIIGPGTTIDGKEYRLVQGELGCLPPVPGRLIEAIKASQSERKANVTSLVKSASDDSVEIPEGNRNGTLFELACKFRDDMLSKLDVLEKLVVVNNAKCDPPLDAEELERIANSAFKKAPSVASFLDRFPGTEKGMCDIYLHRYRGRRIYVPEYSKFGVWNGKIWAFDNSLKVESEVRFITDMYGEAAEEAANHAKDARLAGEEERSEFWKGRTAIYRKLQAKSGSRSGMKNIVELARSQVVVNQEALDSSQFLFGVQNGLVDLHTGQFREHPEASSYMTMQGRVAYQEKTGCPLWKSFLDTCTQGDKELQVYLQKVVGYAMTGSTQEQVFFFLYGMGANGKSTFMNVVQRLLGSYQRSIPSSVLMVKKYGSSGASPELAMLRGCRATIASELEEGERLSESLVKTMTGGDVIPARHLYSEYFEFKAQFKVFMIGNHRPHIMGGDHGIWRRIRLIPFNHSVPLEQRDPHLEAKLLAELPGILNWAIEGCLKWQAEGLGLPGCVKRETDEYRDSEDIMKRFISDRCTLDAGKAELQKTLYDVYRRWAEDNNEWKMSNKAFGNKLKEQGLRVERSNRGNRWSGICVGGPVGRADSVDADSLNYTV